MSKPPAAPNPGSEGGTNGNATASGIAASRWRSPNTSPIKLVSGVVRSAHGFSRMKNVPVLGV